MHKSFFVIILIVTAISITGCASTREFSPSANPIVAIHSNWNDTVANTFATGRYKEKYDALIDKGDEKGAREERRRQVFLLLNGIDTYYDRAIKGKLIAGKAALDTTYDVALLGLTGSATFAGGNTPQVLSAVATVIQGTKSSVDKNFFQDNSSIMLVIKMDQLRHEIYSEIILSLKQSCNDYPLEAAVNDTIRYYSAGTVKSATIAVIKEAGAKQQMSEDESRKLLNENANIAIKKESLKIEKEKKALGVE